MAFAQVLGSGMERNLDLSSVPGVPDGDFIVKPRLEVNFV